MVIDLQPIDVGDFVLLIHANGFDWFKRMRARIHLTFSANHPGSLVYCVTRNTEDASTFGDGFSLTLL